MSKEGQENGKAGEQKPLTVEELTKHVETLTQSVEKLKTENRELLHETMERKEKLKKLETEKTKAEEARLAEEGKFKEMYDNSKPKLERLSVIEPVLQELYDLEIADIPEEKRKIIPEFQTVEQKIKWIKTAKSQNIFGEKAPAQNPPKGSVQSKAGGNNTAPEFLSWAPNDPRLTSLSSNDYLLWKSHNRASKHPTGWGGQAKA